MPKRGQARSSTSPDKVLSVHCFREAKDQNAQTRVLLVAALAVSLVAPVQAQSGVAVGPQLNIAGQKKLTWGWTRSSGAQGDLQASGSRSARIVQTARWISKGFQQRTGDECSQCASQDDLGQRQRVSRSLFVLFRQQG